MRHWCADSALPARAPPLSALSSFRSHALGCIPRRDGKRFLSVLPETGWRLTHSRSRSQAATLKFRSSARRRKSLRHADGIPKGKALWSLLPTSGEAEVGPRRDNIAKTSTNSNLRYSGIRKNRFPFSVVIFATSSSVIPLTSAIFSATRGTYPEWFRLPR